MSNQFEDIDIIKDAPGVLTFLPLLYVGWADSVLSPSEVNLIRKSIEQFRWLSPSEKNIILEWSNPARPPSELLFTKWVSWIREQSSNASLASNQSLVDLGLHMAATGAVHKGQPWSTSEAREALEEIEEALGIVTLKDFRKIIALDDREVEKHVEPPFDIEAMNQILEGKYIETKRRVKNLLSDPLFKLENRPLKEDYRRVVLNWCKLLAEQGLGGLAFPKEYGGGGNLAEYSGVFEVLGYHDLSLAIKFGVQFGLFGGSIMWLGTEKHHKKYLRGIGEMKITGCFAMTETGHGSNVKDIRTTATYDPFKKEFVINTPFEDARKEYIGNALHGRMATVFAQLYSEEKHFGVHAFVVPLRDEKHELLTGVHVEDCGYKLGLNGVDNGKIWFDHVRIPKENLLNRFAEVDDQGNYSSPIESDSRRFFTMLGTLVGGRIAVPKAGLSAAKVALYIATSYGLTRRQFGPENEAETLLLDYPSHQRRLMPMLAHSYALTFALEYLSNSFTDRTEENVREIESLAAGLKAHTTWFTTRTIQECREACGGKGYLYENRFATLKADSDIFTTFEGDNTVLLQLVAKGILSEFKEELNELGVWGWIKFGLTRFSVGITGGFPADNIDEKHLKDDDFQMAVFKYMEREILISVGSRLKRYHNRGLDSYDAYLRCQNQLIKLAKTYINSVVLEQFIVTINLADNPEIKSSLKPLKNLFALHTIESNLDWLLERQAFTPVKSRSVRKLVDKLCLETRQFAPHYIKAFQIPEQSICAPIAGL